jgi:aryl-alcohol dehydrogenase-like predicted oxidoreductase
VSHPGDTPCVRQNAFGSTDLRVSELGFGCARIGGIFQAGGGGFIDLLHAAHDGGITFFDTADMYSQGESETLIGRAFRGRRARVVIASKAGYVLPGRRKLLARVKPLVRPILKHLKIRRDKLPASVRGTVTQDFSPGYLERAVEASLRRLGTDYLDLLQLHSPPEGVIRAGTWQEALDKLKRAGKVRYYGISCDSIDAAKAALDFPIASLQFVLNSLEPRAGDELVPRAREKGVACIARECLANGLLIKAPETIDWSKYTSSPEQREQRLAQLKELRAQAERRGKPLSALALDYVRDLDGVSVTLVGASSKPQLLELLGQASRGPTGSSAPGAGDAK